MVGNVESFVRSVGVCRGMIVQAKHVPGAMNAPDDGNSRWEQAGVLPKLVAIHSDVP